MPKPQRFSITNKLTGEVMDFEFSTIEEAEQVYHAIKSMADIFDRAKKRLIEFIGKQTDERVEFSDGYIGQWIQARRLKYRPEIVRDYLDEDQLSLVMEVNPTKLKELFEQLVKDGADLPPDAWKDIEENAEIVPIKKYFVIKKG